MRTLCLVLLILFSGAALAQDLSAPPPPPDVPLDAVPEPAPKTEVQTKVKVQKQNASLDERPRWARTRAARIVVEVGGGLIGSGLGLAAGYGIGCALSTDSFGRCTGVYPYTMVLGMIAGLAPGVWLAGEVGGADGSLGLAIVGELIGGVAMVPAYLAINALTSSIGGRAPDVLIGGAIGLFFLLPYVGSVLLYEVSASRGDPPEEAEGLPHVLPVAGVSRDGSFTAGISAIF